MTELLKASVLAALIASPVALLGGCTESRSESTHQNWDGTQTTKETTVQKNPITGSTSVQHDESTR